MKPGLNDSRLKTSISPVQWIAIIVVYLFIPLILFLCAGTFRWWQAWAFAFLVVTAGVLGRVLAENRHPGLMAERLRKKNEGETKPWDKVLSPLMSISIGPLMVIAAGLDHRFGGSPGFPLWVVIAGLLLIALGYGFAVWALMENRFFSGVVSIQTDRGHTVCDSGPYKIVRHPGYAGNILGVLGIVLALNSLWALIPAALALFVAVLRTALEDQTLQKELEGYLEYARRVRFRLFPGIY